MQELQGMDREELKSVVTKMYEELMESITQEETPSKEQVSNYLLESSKIILGINETDFNSIELAKQTFSNAYKELTSKSLHSYQKTNTAFDTLTQENAKVIDACTKEKNLPLITEKLNSIQHNMKDEISRANDVISQLMQQVKSLEEKSNLDSLTKVFNRRALSSYLDSICTKEELRFEMHVLILDIDDFKLINDTHGHLAGDKVLILLANILKKTLRDGDKIFRYGGEEFIIILNRIDQQSCQSIIERLLDLVRSNKLIYKGVTLQITMSVGATKFIAGDTPDSLIARADQALYRAKKSGKNIYMVEN